LHYDAFAFSAGGSTPFTYMGTVVAIENANKIITVQAGPNDQLTFNLVNNGTVVKCCSMSKSFSDLKMGDHVTVSYFEENNGNFMTDTVSFVPQNIMEQCS
jgi:hypothetical protein